MTDLTLVVLAKAPVPGRVKTRLCPPCSPAEAALLAEAALTDTLECVRRVPASRYVLALDGRPGRWMPGGYEIAPQRSGTLDRRLAAALATSSGPVLLVGMDTPQLDPALLEAGAEAFRDPAVAALLGPSTDGGYWAIGLRSGAWAAAAVHGIPMSTDHTGRAQMGRFEELGMRVATLPELRDVDRFDDAVAVAGDHDAGHFAGAVRSLVASWAA